MLLYESYWLHCKWAEYPRYLRTGRLVVQPDFPALAAALRSATVAVLALQQAS